MARKRANRDEVYPGADSGLVEMVQAAVAANNPFMLLHTLRGIQMAAFRAGRGDALTKGADPCTSDDTTKN